MKLTIPPITEPVRSYSLGGDSGLPVSVPRTYRPPQIYDIQAWLFAAFSPNGVDAISQIYYSGAGALTVDDATVRVSGCENDGIGALNFLRISVRRKGGTTAAISANTLILSVQPVLAITAVDTATEILTVPAHGLENGEVVQVAGSVVPSGLSAATDYVIRDRTRDTFKLAAALGGAAVNITTAGTAPKLVLRRREIARLKVAAAAAGADPVCDQLQMEFTSGARWWSDQSTYPLQFEYAVSDPSIEIAIEAAGQN